LGQLSFSFITKEVDTMATKEMIKDGVAILALKGKLMGGPDSTALHDRVHGLIADGIKQVVIDLVTKKIESLLLITKLITVFETYETADRAVASFRQ
jgi:anti-sigma B factor antagonist